MDELADIDEDLPLSVMNDIVGAMDAQRLERYNLVRAFPDNTAGGLMDVDATAIRSEVSLKTVYRYLCQHRRRVGELSEHLDSLVVVDRSNRVQGTLALSDTCADSAAGLAARIRTHFPDCDAVVDVADPAGYQFVVNATPMGMEADDPLPFDPDRLDADTFVGEVVMATHHTPILKAALAKGCEVQVGVDMLFAQIPAYLEFFGLPVASSAALRDVAQLGETS